MTVTQAISKLADLYGYEFRGGAAMQETQTGHTLAADAVLEDHRYYYLTGFMVRRHKGRRGQIVP